MAKTMTIKLDGDEELKQKLDKNSEFNLYDAVKKTTASLLRTAKLNTPVQTGKLKQHCYAEMPQDQNNPTGVVYYTMNYAPHVEYGHRTANGGYVNGQYYLKSAVDTAEEEWKNTIKGALKKC